MKNMPSFPADPSEGETMKDDGLLQPTHPPTSRIWTSAHAPATHSQLYVLGISRTEAKV